MPMPPLFLALDSYLIWFYRITGNAPVDFLLGTLVLACQAMFIGEICISLAFLAVRKHIDKATAEADRYQALSLEALAEGGVQCGLPRAVAVELAAQMTLGAAAMVLETGRHPAALKDDVTTPAGCTIAGLLALEDGRIRSVVARGIERATQVAAGLG